jgi:hypothetical protein
MNRVNYTVICCGGENSYCVTLLTVKDANGNRMCKTIDVETEEEAKAYVKRYSHLAKMDPLEALEEFKE